LSVKIYYDQIKYRIHKTKKIKRFLEKVITDEIKTPGDLVFILTNDETLVEINKKFLKRDYYTDVITFDYSADGEMNGEIYMSIDTIRRNALSYKSGVKQELFRVMIHGVLHLCGYEDEKKEDRKKMIRMQEEKLKEFEMMTE
jgi:probable rRNA maturation factor